MSLNQLGTTWPFVPTLSLDGNTLTINYTGSNSVDLASVGGDPSQWATYPAVSDLDISGYVMYNTGRVETGVIRVGTIEPELGGSNIFLYGTLTTNEDVYVSSISVVGLNSTVLGIQSGGSGGDPGLSTAVSTLIQKTDGIFSYDPNTKLTVFNQPPLVPDSGIEVFGTTKSSSDVTALYGSPNQISLINVGLNYNVVMGYYKNVAQGIGSGTTLIDWDDEFPWNTTGFAHLSTPHSIVVDISGVYELSMNMRMSTGTSVVSGTNIRLLSFDLNRGGSNINGLVNATFYNQGNTVYNQSLQGIVELHAGDTLTTSVSQTLTSGNSIITPINGADYNTWATLKLNKRYP
jgi:hypothetical protein